MLAVTMGTQPFGSSKRLNEKGVTKDERNGCTDAFSTREATESGKQVMHGTVTDRVLRFYGAILPNRHGSPWSARCCSPKSFKETEGQPLVLRWAKALKHFAEQAAVAIFDDELIVGRSATSTSARGGATSSASSTTPIRRRAQRSRTTNMLRPRESIQNPARRDDDHGYDVLSSRRLRAEGASPMP